MSALDVLAFCMLAIFAVPAVTIIVLAIVVPLPRVPRASDEVRRQARRRPCRRW